MVQSYCYKVMQRFGQLGLLLVNTILKNVVQLWVLSLFNIPSIMLRSDKHNIILQTRLSNAIKAQESEIICFFRTEKLGQQIAYNQITKVMGEGGKRMGGYPSNLNKKKPSLRRIRVLFKIYPNCLPPPPLSCFWASPNSPSVT